MPTSMNDVVLIRIIEEMSKPLANLDPHCSADEMVSSYNALLGAAQANHPDVPFLNTMEPLQQKSINAAPCWPCLRNSELSWSIFRKGSSSESG